MSASLVMQPLNARTAENPILYADVPDMSIVRVNDTYFMSSTTMHLSPGIPIMSSGNLVDWSLKGYVYDTLAENDALTLKNGKNAYGAGSWASSLQYHGGKFYVACSSSSTGRTHVYSSSDPSGSPWSAVSFEPLLHDGSLFFDDDGRVYMIHGSGSIWVTELTAEATGLKDGGLNKEIIHEAQGVASSKSGFGLPAEGSQIRKINGQYYILNITWPRNDMRTVIVHRSSNIAGPYEGRVVLRDRGIAQGGLIDTPKGDWFAYLFQDSGAVGRIPYLVPVAWVDGWPVFGGDGRVPQSLPLSSNGLGVGSLVTSDEFDSGHARQELALAWQWNHNPDNALWSLNERPGFLRLKTGAVAHDLEGARNSLTQRTFGPTCSASTSLDVGMMRDGDWAGLGLLQKHYGFVGVRMRDGAKAIVVGTAAGDEFKVVDSVDLAQSVVYLRAHCDFAEHADLAGFDYSLDGRKWKPIGGPFHMRYTLPHFMGYRFALFNFSTLTPGGHVDFNFFHVNDKPDSID